MNELEHKRNKYSDYVVNEPIKEIQVVFCSECRHAEPSSNHWGIICKRLHRSRHKGDYCRVVKKEFGYKQGWVFWDCLGRF